MNNLCRKAFIQPHLVNNAKRVLSTTLVKKEIFKVQSSEDFEQKVKKSDKVVIVDFFAT